MGQSNVTLELEAKLAFSSKQPVSLRGTPSGNSFWTPTDPKEKTECGSQPVEAESHAEQAVRLRHHPEVSEGLLCAELGKALWGTAKMC